MAAQAQGNSPTNNSPTNSFPQTPSLNIHLPGIWNAIDCDDCDTYYNKQKQNLAGARDKAIEAALAKYSAAIASAYQNYRTAFQLENASFNSDMAHADADF